jgi:hypothetical protein
MEETLMSTPIEGEYNSLELLKIFSEEAEQGIIVVMEVTKIEEVEEEEGSIDFADMYEEV